MKIENKTTYKIVQPEDGFVLTNNSDDIIRYVSFTECICPINCDLTHLKEVTLDEDKAFKEESEKLRNEEKERYLKEHKLNHND